MKNKKLITIILIVGVFISAFLISFLSIYPWWVSSTQTKPPRGIILISLDTLRADHLGIYGYHRNTSPSIDAFAKESIVFEHAVVQSPWTLPSHMSIMTSLYPSFHGVTKRTERLADEHVTLAELLREGRYRTAAFTDGGYMRAVFGFNQGFDFYGGFRRRGIARILPEVKKWLDENKSNPFFLFIHCYDIHQPYDPPPPYNSIFHDFPYTGHLTPNGKTLLAAWMNRLKVNDEDLRHFIALYDGGIRYTDKKIGEFLSYLRESGLEDQSLIIITSDHGEEFKEHGSFLHNKLYYRPNLHVPLIMRLPNYPKKEIRIKELVQSIDLLPTILEIAGLPAHPKAQGRSLLPFIKRYKNSLHLSLWQVFHPFKKDSVISFAEAPWTNNYSIITDGYQMIYYPKSHSIQLFNLKADPLAKNDIAKDHDDILARLLSQFKEVYSATPSHKAPIITLDEQTREQLKVLGYIDGLEHTADDSDFDGIPDKKTSDDSDFDGILDKKDNCLYFPNPNQEDQDSDGLGNFCDNCPDDYNPDQSDHDQDGIGDVCDCTDTDGDGYGNPGFPNTCDEDNCPDNYNPGQVDTYPPGGNGIGDACECEGDFDCDGDVDDSDAATFKADFGRSLVNDPCTNESQCNGDFDCDGDVDWSDAEIFKSDFGRNALKNPCPPCAERPYCVY